MTTPLNLVGSALPLSVAAWVVPVTLVLTTTVSWAGLRATALKPLSERIKNDMSMVAMHLNNPAAKTIIRLVKKCLKGAQVKIRHAILDIVPLPGRAESAM